MAAPPGNHAKMRVLIVDDSSDAVLLLSRLLGISGHEVRSANSGLEALKLAPEFLPEVVFVDLWMPRMHGYDLAKQLRQIEGLKNSRIIALSGANPNDAQLREAGIDCQLLKPVSLKQMLRAMGCAPT